MLRHSWVEVKDGVLRQYPVYRCDRCMTVIRAKEIKDRSWNGYVSELELLRMTPDMVARGLGILDDCNKQLVMNVTES